MVSEAKFQSLTAAEALFIDEAFSEMDGDGDGLVSHEEFTAALHADEELSEILSRGTISRKGKRYLDLKEISQLWHMIDRDLDDGLTLEEMKALWHEPPLASTVEAKVESVAAEVERVAAQVALWTRTTAQAKDAWQGAQKQLQQAQDHLQHLQEEGEVEAREAGGCVICFVNDESKAILGKVEVVVLRGLVASTTPRQLADRLTASLAADIGVDRARFKGQALQICSSAQSTELEPDRTLVEQGVGLVAEGEVSLPEGEGKLRYAQDEHPSSTLVCALGAASGTAQVVL